MGMENWSYP